MALVPAVSIKQKVPGDPVHDHRNDRKQGDREDIIIFDMGNFMSDHGFQFFLAQQTHHPFGHADTPVAESPAKGKGIGDRQRRDANLRHGNIGPLGLVLDHGIKPRILFFFDIAYPHRPFDHLGADHILKKHKPKRNDQIKIKIIHPHGRPDHYHNGIDNPE